MDKPETAESLSEQVRTKLLEELLARLRVLRDPPGLHLDEIEAAAHVLNALDPARSGFLTGSYATLKAEQTTP